MNSHNRIIEELTQLKKKRKEAIQQSQLDIQKNNLQFEKKMGNLQQLIESFSDKDDRHVPKVLSPTSHYDNKERNRSRHNSSR